MYKHTLDKLYSSAIDNEHTFDFELNYIYSREGVDLLFKEKEAEKIILKEENKKKIISSIEDLLSM